MTSVPLLTASGFVSLSFPLLRRRCLRLLRSRPRSNNPNPLAQIFFRNVDIVHTNFVGSAGFGTLALVDDSVGWGPPFCSGVASDELVWPDFGFIHSPL